MAKKDINKDKKNKNFSKELKSELKKVSWPTLKELVNSTSAVVAIVLIVAVIVFVLDVCFENLNDLGVGKIKSLVSSDETTSEESGTVEEQTDLGDGIELTTDESAEESTETTTGEGVEGEEAGESSETENVQ